MSVRWILCPMVLVEGPPALALIEDPEAEEEPGVPAGFKTNPFKLDRFESKARALVMGRVQVVAHVQNAHNRWCLCQIRADDFSGIDADLECISLFEEDEATFDTQFGEGLTETFRVRGWTQGRLNQLKNLAEDNGIDLSGITLSLDTPKKDVLKAIKDSINAGRVR